MKKRNLWFYLLAISCFTLCLFLFAPPVAAAEDLTFTLNTSGYESGTWSNQDITVEMVYSGQDEVAYQYSLDEENWQAFNGTMVFDVQGIYTVYFRLATDLSVSIHQFINIKLDKTKPEIEFVLKSSFFPTKDDVLLTVIASDDRSNVTFYKFANHDWQELNVFSVISNRTFSAGEILIKDGAGNIAAYDEEVVVDNIDKQEPLFRVISSTEKMIRKDHITFQISVPVSGLQSFLVTLPNGDLVDITETYENGFEVLQNGEYIFTVTSNSGLSTSVLVDYENIQGFLSNFELFILICVFIIMLVFTALIFPMIIKNKKNKNNNKKFSNAENI